MVSRNYWWLGVTKEVGKYIEGCDACQRYKNRSEAPAGKLMPNTIPEKPWSHISADFITKLPLAQGYDAVLVICDRFSKMAHFIATTEKTSAEGLASCFGTTYRNYTGSRKASYRIRERSLRQE